VATDRSATGLQRASCRDVPDPHAPPAVEDLAREARRASETLRLAKALDPQPAKGTGADPKLVDGYDGSADQDEFRIVFATLLLAQRTGRAVYSDARFIRETARSVGIPAFATLALLDAIVEHGVIDADARARARRALAHRGGRGVEPSGEELAAAEAGFELTPDVRAVLYDRAAWRSSSAGRAQGCLPCSQPCTPMIRRA
jgi:hypothetical protein